jgi:homoserine dehydrogenase
MARKKLTIGLYGFGCVGTGLYEVLQKTPTLNASIKKICVKNRNKIRALEAEHYTYDPQEILNDPEINVVVELIDDADAAYEIVTAALKRGKAVVTANKKMLAEHLEELIALQEEYKVPLLYEASCCASIPIIRNLEEYYDNELLESVEGIVNGSTNYILTKIDKENKSYEAALQEAQAKGYAESDPLLDTGGYDAKYKLLIISAHAFGIILKPADILNLGIDRLSKLELQYAREKGLKIKLVAKAYKQADGSVAAFVAPHFIKPSDKLYQVDDVYNGVITKTVFSEDQFFVGKGAGAYSTGSAVISDLSALTYDYKYEYKKLQQSDINGLSTDISLKVFASYDKEFKQKVSSFFTEEHEHFSNSNDCYTIGTLPLANFIALSQLNISSIVVVETLPELNPTLVRSNEAAAEYA